MAPLAAWVPAVVLVVSNLSRVCRYTFTELEDLLQRAARVVHAFRTLLDELRARDKDLPQERELPDDGISKHRMGGSPEAGGVPSEGPPQLGGSVPTADDGSEDFAE